jgi:hypothetical protein
MVPSARNLAAAVLVIGIALANPLHASSGGPDGQPGSGQGTGILAWAADLWSSDWLFNLLHRAWTKNGPTLDPSGTSNTSQPSAPSNGPTLDPSGTSNTSQPPTSSAGGTLDPSGSKVRRLRPTLSTGAHPALAN